MIGKACTYSSCSSMRPCKRNAPAACESCTRNDQMPSDVPVGISFARRYEASEDCMRYCAAGALTRTTWQAAQNTMFRCGRALDLNANCGRGMSAWECLVWPISVPRRETAEDSYCSRERLNEES